MADDTQYWSYEQVLQELQINRSQLNQLIREGRLREHVVEGETKFRLVEVQDVKRSLEKRPTVMEGALGAEEPTTDMLTDEPAAVSSAEPETEVLAGQEQAAEKETDVLEGAQRSTVVDRDTEILEEEEPIGEELGMPAPTEEEQLAMEEELADEPSASDSALETELNLPAQAEAAEQPAAEDAFDFSEQDEFELEEPGTAVTEDSGEQLTLEESSGDQLTLDESSGEQLILEESDEIGLEEAIEEEEEIVTDILDLGVDEEVPEEDLLSEIMDIEEEQAAPAAGLADDTEDLTAEITTLEEPTYEDSDLGEVLEVEDLEGADDEFGVEDDLFVAAAVGAPVEAGVVSSGWTAVLLITVAVMLLGTIFVLENSFSPGWNTGLVGWVAGIF